MFCYNRPHQATNALVSNPLCLVIFAQNNCAKVGGLSCAYATVPGTSPPPDQKVVGRIGYVCPTYLETGQKLNTNLKSKLKNESE